MTAIIGFIDNKNKKIIMGGDSLSSDNYKKFSRKDEKVFVKDNYIYGFCNDYKILNLVKYHFIAPEWKYKSFKKYDNTTFINKIFIPSLADFLQDNDIEIENDRMGHEELCLIGFNGSLYKIYDDMEVEELVMDWNTCGSGGMYLLGYFEGAYIENNTIDIEKLIKNAIYTTAERIPSVGGNVDIKELSYE